MARNRMMLGVVDLLRSGALELDCALMELVQDDAEAPRLYRGPGYIRQDDKGWITFKMFPTETRNLPSGLGSGRTGAAGTLLSADQYYNLVATDAWARQWRAERIIPDLSYGGGTGGIISASGIVHALVNVEKRSYSANYYKLHFFEDMEFPCNSNTTTYKDTGSGPELSEISGDLVKLTSADCDISIHRGNGFVTVTVSATGHFPSHIETRIVESLQFVLARSLWYRAVESLVGNDEMTKLISPRRVSVRTRLQEPIHLGTVAGREHVWQLFDLYFRYVIRRGDPGWHPCSVHLHAACEASANSLEAYALGLAIAVEGMTNVLFPDCGRIDRLYKDVVDDLCKHVNTWPARGPEEIVVRVRDRIAGFRGQLLQVRAVDRMYKLSQEGVLDERYIGAWKKLRNTSAHAGAPGTPVNQELVDEIMAVTVLMYHLVFHAIGYNGRYVDYSTRGYPPRCYPSRVLAPDQEPESGMVTPATKVPNREENASAEGGEEAQVREAEMA